MFMEGSRLFAHRSWSGFGIYEAKFASTEGDTSLSRRSSPATTQSTCALRTRRSRRLLKHSSPATSSSSR